MRLLMTPQSLGRPWGQGTEAAEAPSIGSAAPDQPQSTPDGAPAAAAAAGGRRDTTMDILHLLASLDFTQGGGGVAAGSGANAGTFVHTPSLLQLVLSACASPHVQSAGCTIALAICASHGSLLGSS